MYYISGWWFQPLWKIWKSVGIMFSRYMEKCSKPPNRYNITYPSSKLCILELVFPPSFAPCEYLIFPPLLTLLTLLTRAENKTNVSELYMICWPVTLLQCSSRCCKSQQHECEHHREKTTYPRGEKKQPMALAPWSCWARTLNHFSFNFVSCSTLDTTWRLFFSGHWLGIL